MPLMLIVLISVFPWVEWALLSTITSCFTFTRTFLHPLLHRPNHLHSAFEWVNATFTHERVANWRISMFAWRWIVPCFMVILIYVISVTWFIHTPSIHRKWGWNIWQTRSDCKYLDRYLKVNLWFTTLQFNNYVPRATSFIPFAWFGKGAKYYFINGQSIFLTSRSWLSLNSFV